MCIRDRICVAQGLQILLLIECLFMFPFHNATCKNHTLNAKFGNCKKPVSYTHLDVYKRQHHTRGEVFDRYIQKVVQFGKIHNLIKMPIHEFPIKTHDCTIEIDVLAGGQI